MYFMNINRVFYFTNMLPSNSIGFNMTSMKPELLRKMVSDSRSLSPPLINREPKSGSVNEMDILYNRVDQQVSYN